MSLFYKIVAFFMSLFIFSPVSEIASYTASEKEKDLSFTILSDTHIEGNNEERFQLFGEALSDVNKAPKNDALVFLGDNTMNGQVIEQSAFYKILNKYTTIGNVLMVAGNHDVCANEYNVGDYETLKNRFFTFRNDYIKAQYDDSIYYSYSIDNYKFIILGTESDSWIKEDISEEQFKWLENQLKEAEKSDNPVFIFNHYPLNNTWADVWTEGHIGEDSDRLYSMLKDCNNKVLFFSGHLHMGLYDDKREVVYDDNVTFINVPSFGSENTDGDADIQQTGMGHYVEVFENEVVINVRDFTGHKWMNVEYVIDLQN